MRYLICAALTLLLSNAKAQHAPSVVINADTKVYTDRDGSKLTLKNMQGENAFSLHFDAVEMRLTTDGLLPINSRLNFEGITVHYELKNAVQVWHFNSEDLGYLKIERLPNWADIAVWYPSFGYIDKVVYR